MPVPALQLFALPNFCLMLLAFLSQSQLPLLSFLPLFYFLCLCSLPDLAFRKESESRLLPMPPDSACELILYLCCSVAVRSNVTSQAGFSCLPVSSFITEEFYLLTKFSSGMKAITEHTKQEGQSSHDQCGTW